MKREVVAQLDGIADADSVIASNSSSYTISEIIDGLSLNYPERMVSLHSCELYQTLLDNVSK